MRREASVAIAIALLAIALVIRRAVVFLRQNLRDLFLVNMPVLVARSARSRHLTGEIDISVGSAFAICSIVAGIVAKSGRHHGPVWRRVRSARCLGRKRAGRHAHPANRRHAGRDDRIARRPALGRRSVDRKPAAALSMARRLPGGVSMARPAVVAALAAAVAWTVRHVAGGRAVRDGINAGQRASPASTRPP